LQPSDAAERVHQWPAAAVLGQSMTLLLPSAALQGMRLGDDDHEARPPGSSPKSSAERNELMQVQCQVLNASRVVAPTM
jgi:hypothetical protein